MPKYRIGEKVRVRRDIKCRDYSMINEDGTPGQKRYAVGSMTALAGRVATIEGYDEGCYKIDLDNFSWTDEMFEPVKSFVCKSLL